MEYHEGNREIDEVLHRALLLLNQSPPICMGICFFWSCMLWLHECPLRQTLLQGVSFLPIWNCLILDLFLTPPPIFFPPSLTKKRTDAKYNAKPWVIPQCTDQYLRPVSWQLYQLKYISWPWVISPCVVAHTCLISNALLWQQLWPVNSAFHKYRNSNTLSPALVKAWIELSSQLRHAHL